MMTLSELIVELDNLRQHYNGTLPVILENEHVIVKVEYNDDVEPCIMILAEAPDE